MLSHHVTPRRLVEPDQSASPSPAIPAILRKRQRTTSHFQTHFGISNIIIQRLRHSIQTARARACVCDLWRDPVALDQLNYINTHSLGSVWETASSLSECQAPSRIFKGQEQVRQPTLSLSRARTTQARHANVYVRRLFRDYSSKKTKQITPNLPTTSPTSPSVLRPLAHNAPTQARPWYSAGTRVSYYERMPP